MEAERAHFVRFRPNLHFVANAVHLPKKQDEDFTS
jgi:hypothetical protein